MRLTARKTGVGAVSLAVLVGLAASPAVSAQAVTGSGSAPQQAAAATKAAPDELPNAFEDKRRALRAEALQDVIKGTKKAEKRGASTVVDLGKADAAPPASLKGAASPPRRPRTSTSSSPARRPTRSSSCSPSSATSGTRATRTRTRTRASPGPTTLRRPAAQRDPGAGPRDGQLDRLAAGLRPGRTSSSSTSARATASSR